jgi:hypothetical protein
MAASFRAPGEPAPAREHIAPAAIRPPQETRKTRPVWLVTETAYGKAWGWRHFLHREDAEETARRWRSQNVGLVTVEEVEVPVNA